MNIFALELVEDLKCMLSRLGGGLGVLGGAGISLSISSNNKLTVTNNYLYEFLIVVKILKYYYYIIRTIFVRCFIILIFYI